MIRSVSLPAPQEFEVGIMLFQLNKPRRFEYHPRFAAEDDAEESKKRIRFRRIRHSPPVKRQSMLRLAMLLIMLVLLFNFLSRKSVQGHRGKSPEGPIKVEEVIVVD